MNKKHIQELLDKYFEGETTLTEEKELKDFFLHTALLPEEWKAYRQMFIYFDSEGKRTMPTSHSATIRKNILWTAGIGLSVAASIFLLFSIFLPSTQSELKPYAAGVKKMDTGFVTEPGKRTAAAEITARKQSSTKVNVGTVVKRSPLNAGSVTEPKNSTGNQHQQSALSEVIDASLAPLDNMAVIDQAMDKFKYFDLMNKYLPDKDLSSIIKANP